MRIERRGPGVILVAAFLAALFALTLLAVPAAAQEGEEEPAQAAEETTAVAEDQEPAAEEQEPAEEQDPAAKEGQDPGQDPVTGEAQDPAAEEDQEPVAEEEQPAEENPDKTATAAEDEEPVVGAQETTDRTEEDTPEENVQEGGQQVQTRANDDTQAARANEGCGNPQRVRVFAGTENRRTSEFRIDGASFRLSYEVEVTDPDGFPVLEVDVLDDSGQFTGEGFLSFGEDGSENILEGSGNYSLEIDAEDVRYRITVEDCGRVANNNNGDGNGDARDNDDERNLNCDELLRRFRNAGGQGQYGNGDFFGDVDIRNQIIICLEQEVDQDTAADGKLPNTGGPTLLGLAALGLVSAAVGFSLVRGSRRED